MPDHTGTESCFDSPIGPPLPPPPWLSLDACPCARGVEAAEALAEAATDAHAEEDALLADDAARVVATEACGPKCVCARWCNCGPEPGGVEAAEAVPEPPPPPPKCPPASHGTLMLSLRRAVGMSSGEGATHDSASEAAAAAAAEAAAAASVVATEKCAAGPGAAVATVGGEWGDPAAREDRAFAGEGGPAPVLRPELHSPHMDTDT
jgi:hypothetical protein